MHSPHPLRLGLAAVALLGLAAAQPARADLITNGGFENTNNTFVNNGAGAQSLPNGSNVIPGWTVTNAELAWTKNGNNYGLAANDGSFFLDLTGYHDSAPYSGVTQTIGTTQGDSYHLSFAIGTDQDNGSYSGPVGIMATAGSALQTFTFTPAAGLTGNQHETVGLNFTANAANTPITLIGTQGSQYIGLDSVSVTPNAPVPEASTTVSFGLLLALGLGGMAVVAKKRRKAMSR